MTASESDPLVAQTFWPRRAARLCRRGVLQHQDPLGRVEVDAGEVDLLQPGAGDRHRVRHDVHGAGGDVGYPLRVGDRLVLDLVRVAEDGLGHRPDHVDVEALDLPGERVEEAEVVGALVHPRDEVAAGADLRHERAGRHLRRAGRAQAARLRIAAWPRSRLGQCSRCSRCGWCWRRGSRAAGPARRRRRGAQHEPERREHEQQRARPQSPGRPGQPGRAFTGTPRAGGSVPRRSLPPSPATPRSCPRPGR